MPGGEPVLFGILSCVLLSLMFDGANFREASWQGGQGEEREQGRMGHLKDGPQLLQGLGSCFEHVFGHPRFLQDLHATTISIS